MSLMEQEAANLDNLFSLMYLWFVESLHLSSLEKNKSCIISPQVATRRGLDSFLALFNHLSVQFLSLSSCFSISDSVLVIHPLVSYCSSIVQGAPIRIFLFLWRRRTWKKKERKKPENPTKIWLCLNNIPTRLIRRLHWSSQYAT